MVGFGWSDRFTTIWNSPTAVPRYADFLATSQQFK